MTTKRDAGDDLLLILDQLDELIATARSMPMSSSAILNRDEALGLIDRARQAVPTALRRAEQIVADADAVLAQGREESERIIQHAHEEAERLIAGENIVHQANDRADAIVAAAEEHAAQLRNGADDYCDRSLATLGGEIDRLSEQVRAGREVLAQRMEHRSASSAEESAQGGFPRRWAGWSVDPATAH